MIAACQLCGELLRSDFVGGVDGPGRTQAEFVSLVDNSRAHLARHHREHLQVFAAVVNAVVLYMAARHLSATDDRLSACVDAALETVLTDLRGFEPVRVVAPEKVATC